jgi:hypothetical protein
MERAKHLLVLSFISTVLLITPALAQQEPGRVKQEILKAVVKIDVQVNPKGKPEDWRSGTGFLVCKEITRNGQKYRAVFLVTNKHMLGDWTLADRDVKRYYDKLKVFFYRTATASGVCYEEMEIGLIDQNGKPKGGVWLHPEPGVDVAIIALGPELSPANRIDLVGFDTSYLLPFDKIMTSSTGLGDQVFAIGYPGGVTSLKNSYPLAKSSYLASLPGVEVAVKTRGKNRNGESKITTVEGKILLVDGLIVGGNSGSAVVLPAGIKMRLNPQTKSLEYTKELTENLVIGIVSGGFDALGLAYIYSSDYILELIDQTGAERK